MYAKLDKLRADLKKAVAKKEEAIARVKQIEERLREEEAAQIVNDVTSYNMSPEQLAQFLKLANSGQLQSLLNGQAAQGAVAESHSSTASYLADTNRDKDEDMEEIEDDEN